MPAYMIARIEVTDAGEYGKYAAQTAEIAAKFGGRFLVKGGESKVIEGGWPGRTAVIAFPDMASAEAWYNSAEYQKILPLALANSRRDMVFVEGV